VGGREADAPGHHLNAVTHRCATSYSGAGQVHDRRRSCREGCTRLTRRRGVSLVGWLALASLDEIGREAAVGWARILRRANGWVSAEDCIR
jgi:hypothetical protein